MDATQKDELKKYFEKFSKNVEKYTMELFAKIGVDWTEDIENEVKTIAENA